MIFETFSPSEVAVVIMVAGFMLENLILALRRKL